MSPSNDQIEENLAALEYKPGEDIYNKSKKQQDINPDDNSIIKDRQRKKLRP